MNRILFVLTLIVVLLPSCAPSLGESLSPTPYPPTSTSIPFVVTPTPPTETPTPTPIAFTLEQLKGMPVELKLSAAPQATSAPADVLAAFLPAGANAADVVWEQRVLAYWERVVAYHGLINGQDIVLYYDLESGQWAKKYDSFEQLSQIPKDQIPDVMFLGDRLIRAKLQYDYDWIAQPQAMTADGKKIFRDEKGYPKAVWDTVNLTWLTPEEADVVYTLERWKRMFDVPFVNRNGKELNYNILFDKKRSEILTDPAQIERLPNGTEIMVLNPSGEIMIWTSQKDAAERAKEGATIIIGTPGPFGRNDNFFDNGWLAWNIAFIEYQKGNKTIYLTYNDVGVEERLQIKGWFSPFISINLDNLPKIEDKEGRIVCPVIRMPKYFISEKISPGKGELISVEISNPDFWLDEIIKAGANEIIVFNLRGGLENDE
ncbi:MAG: hypothetical protein Q7U34_06405 [Anaerolineales bacterium]|nr:hypothetical protein [Anaerolineales bacterium]